MTKKKGPFTPRTEITILPADDPNKKRLGWKILELGIGETMKDYLSPEDFEIYEASVNPSQNQNSDRADKYIGSQGFDFDEDTSSCWTTLSVLEFLWGQPWNNLALNFVSTLRPSSLRVTSDGITLDCCNWRVTVWLEKDNKTINRIEQSVSMSGYGARNAHDISMQLAYQKEHGNLEGYEYPEPSPVCIINDYAIAKLEVEDNKDE